MKKLIAMLHVKGYIQITPEEDVITEDVAPPEGGYEDPPEDIQSEGTSTILTGLVYLGDDTDADILYYTGDIIHVEYAWDTVQKLIYGAPTFSVPFSPFKDFWVEWEVTVVNKTTGDAWAPGSEVDVIDGSGLIATDFDSDDGLWTVFGVKSEGGSISHTAYTMDYWSWTREFFSVLAKYYVYLTWRAASKTLSVAIYNASGDMVHGRTFTNQDDYYDETAGHPLVLWSKYRTKVYSGGEYHDLPAGWKIVTEWKALRGWTK
ncbi:MAG: hypothetical protein H0Z33_16700 [Bacillaceae bacterium]|nr:hypothetical protein [Bacillaceae bacterium]